jgi:hypothetical protein
VPVGKMKTEYTEQIIHNNKNTQLTKLIKSVQNINHIYNDKKGPKEREGI